MKNLILISITMLSLTSALFAGEVEIGINTTADTCGEAGVKSYETCIAKTEEDVFRVLDIKTEYISETKIGGQCVVTAKCSFYQIID